MALDVFQSSVCGKTLTYAVSPRGRYLYEQKRRRSPDVWARLLVNAMKRAGFSLDAIREAWPVLSDNYASPRFYRPVWQVVREQIDLSC